MRGSYRSVVAIDETGERVMGFVNMLSDGLLTAFIPWLEVLPEHQGAGRRYRADAPDPGRR